MSNRRVAQRGPAKPSLLILIAVGAVLLLARGASAGTITVMWDRIDQPNVTGYRVHVGTGSRAYSQTFDVPATSDSFSFQNAFQGTRYYFAVAAQFDGERYGPLSDEVTGVGTRAVGGSLPDGARIADGTRPAGCVADCFVVSDIASGLSEVSALAVVSENAVFAVEGGQKVLLLRDGGTATAFEAEPGTVIRDIALDPRFDSNGLVFLTVVRPRDSLAGELDVLRLRYLAGRLAEPASVASGVTVPLDASIPLAVDGDGLVYLAIPALRARDPYSAAILSFDQDGRVPAGQTSPVFARGFDAPADMAWDAQLRSLWVIGRDSGSDAQVLSLSRAAAGGTYLPNVTTPGESAAGVAIASGTVRRLVVASGADLVETAPGTADSLRIPLEAYGTPVAVAVRGGTRYVATRTDDAYRIVKVASAPSAAPK